MAKNEFDPYREALVVEAITDWPEEYESLDPSVRAKIAQKLHSQPQEATELEYVRQHTGFCRRIVVTPADVERLQ